MLTYQQHASIFGTPVELGPLKHAMRNEIRKISPKNFNDLGLSLYKYEKNLQVNLTQPVVDMKLSQNYQREIWKSL